MHPLTALNIPARLAGLQLPNGLRPPQGGAVLGQVGVVAKPERANLISVTEGLAMAGGGIFALLNVPGTRRVNQVALGALGGGLLLTGLLKVYDGLA